jgi:hypothetical protein
LRLFRVQLRPACLLLRNRSAGKQHASDERH